MGGRRLKRGTRLKIKGYLEGFLTGLLEETGRSGIKRGTKTAFRDKCAKGEYKPFHEALLPETVIRNQEFERKFSTRLGSSFEEAARLIALDSGFAATRGLKLKGTINAAVFSEIENTVNSLRESGSPQDFYTILRRLKKRNKSGETKSITIAVDLFVSKGNREFYFEIKSPKPNKGQCLEVLERLLRIQATKSFKANVKTYYAMPYNPFGEKKLDYKHWVSGHLDLDRMVLLGQEFWDFLGGNGTYKELVSIYAEVGREKGPDIIERLANGFST
jgi:hypothetical protein